MDSQHTRKTQLGASSPAVWTMRWESASREGRPVVRHLAAVAAAIALLVLVFAGAPAKSGAPAGHVPPPAQQASTAIPAGAAMQLTGDQADLVSWLEQNQASDTGSAPAAPDPTDLVHWLEQSAQMR